jgi:purD: phosphoribosylamine--glycine ligase
VTVYHAGTAIKDGSLVTNGGRVLGVTATANTLPEALKKAYAATESIHFDKLHKRSDSWGKSAGSDASKRPSPSGEAVTEGD